MKSNHKWFAVSNPIKLDEKVPPEKKIVLVWLRDRLMPYCGFLRYAAGDKNCPYFVVYHGNPEIGSDVVAWSDCLPDTGPDFENCAKYNKYQK